MVWYHILLAHNHMVLLNTHLLHSQLLHEQLSAQASLLSSLLISGAGS